MKLEIVYVMNAKNFYNFATIRSLTQFWFYLISIFFKEQQVYILF